MNLWMFLAAYLAGLMGTATLYFRHIVSTGEWTFCGQCRGTCKVRDKWRHDNYHETRTERNLNDAWRALLPGAFWPIAILPILLFKLTPLTPAESKARITALERELEMERTS